MPGQFLNLRSNHIILDTVKQAFRLLLMMGKALNILVKFRNTFYISDPEQIVFHLASVSQKTRERSLERFTYAFVLEGKL